MTGALGEALIAVAAVAASLGIFAEVGRRTLAAIPRTGGASMAHRP